MTRSARTSSCFSVAISYSPNRVILGARMVSLLFPGQLQRARPCWAPRALDEALGARASTARGACGALMWDTTEPLAAAAVGPVATAAAAAVREAAEEASVSLDPASLVWFAYWVPPPVMPIRFATFFFAARHDEPASEVLIDDGEITEHEWMRPVDAMARRDGGEIELAPPTWMTLYRLSGFTTIAEALVELDAEDPPVYETHMARTDDGPVAMWTGDAGYESSDPSIEGPRHRLTLIEDGYVFADTR